MNSAEKRAEMGEDWPDCECHGEPMYWHTHRFRCRIDVREAAQRLRERRKQSDLCVYCPQPAVTETMCAKHADAHAELMSQPKQALDHFFANLRYQGRHRQYKATGVLTRLLGD